MPGSEIAIPETKRYFVTFDQEKFSKLLIYKFKRQTEKAGLPKVFLRPKNWLANGSYTSYSAEISLYYCINNFNPNECETECANPRFDMTETLVHEIGHWLCDNSAAKRRFLYILAEAGMFFALLCLHTILIFILSGLFYFVGLAESSVVKWSFFSIFFAFGLFVLTFVLVEAFKKTEEKRVRKFSFNVALKYRRFFLKIYECFSFNLIDPA